MFQKNNLKKFLADSFVSMDTNYGNISEKRNKECNVMTCPSKKEKNDVPKKII